MKKKQKKSIPKKKSKSIPKSTACFVALFTEDGEVKGGSYCRQKVAKWELDNINECFVNADEIRFPKATRCWGIITHFALYDRIKNGRKLRDGNLHKKLAVNADDISKFRIGDLDIDWP